MAAADKLVDQFQRMVRRDGGSLHVLSLEDGVLRVGYALGSDPDCADGACVLPHVELEQMMNEAAPRYDQSLRVVVQPMPAGAGGEG